MKNALHLPFSETTTSAAISTTEEISTTIAATSEVETSLPEKITLFSKTTETDSLNIYEIDNNISLTTRQITKDPVVTHSTTIKTTTKQPVRSTVTLPEYKIPEQYSDKAKSSLYYISCVIMLLNSYNGGLYDIHMIQ